MLLSSLLNATFLSAGSQHIDVEQLLTKLLDWGIEVGKDLLGAIIITLSDVLSLSRSDVYFLVFWKRESWRSAFRLS